MSFLRKVTRDVPADRKPRIQLVVKAKEVSYDMKSPQLAFACFITQRLERNRYFDGPAVAREHAFRFHHDVNAEIRARAFGHDAVLLDAERIPTKYVRSPLVVEGVQKNSDVVVAENLIALANRGFHLSWIVVAVKTQVKKL